MAQCEKNDDNSFSIDCILRHRVLFDFIDEESDGDSTVNRKEDKIIKVERHKGNGHKGVNTDMFSKLQCFLFSGSLLHLNSKNIAISPYLRSF